MWDSEQGGKRVKNGAKIEMMHCFGLNPKPVERYFSFIEDDSGFGIRSGNNLLYTTSQHVLCHNVETRTQTQIQFDRKGEITFLTNIKHKEEIVLLMAETSRKDPPSVLLLKLSPEKLTRLPHSHLPPGAILRSVQVTKGEVKNKKLCYSLCWRPGTVSVWRLDKQALVAVCETACVQPHMALDPADPCRFLLAGAHYLRALQVKVLEKQVEEDKVHLVLPKVEREEFFLDLVFVPNSRQVLVLCAGSRLLIVENGNVIGRVDNVMAGNRETEEEAGESPVRWGESPQEPSEAGRMILTRKILVFGGSGGVVSVYYFEAGLPTYISSFRLDPKGGQVLSLSLSLDEQWLAAACQLPIETIDSASTPKTSRTAELDDWGDQRIESFLVNMRKLESENTHSLSHLLPSPHYGPVLDSSIAVSRHLLVTIGEDMYLKVWKRGKVWGGGPGVRLMDPPTAVSIHPEGFQVAVGSRESLKLFIVLEDDVALSVDKSVKTCNAVAYSPNGEYLAFSSGSLILVLSPYTSQQLASLYGHSTAIQSLIWTHKPGQLISSCLSGTVCVWSMSDPEPKTFTNRQHKLISAAYDEALEELVLLTQDGKVRMVNGEETRMELEAGEDGKFTSLMLRAELGVLLLGTEKGTLQMRLWPVTSLADCQSFPLHSKSITSMTLSQVYSELLTTSEDHTFCISHISLYDSGSLITLNDYLVSSDLSKKHLQLIPSVDYLSLSELSLVRDTYVQVQANRVQELEDSISTLQSKFKYKTETADKQYQDLLANMKADSTRMLEIAQSEIQDLKRKYETEHTDKLETLAAVRVEYERQITEEIRKAELRDIGQREKYESLTDELEELKQEYSHQLQVLSRAHEQVKTAIQYDASGQIDQIRSDYDDLVSSLQRQGQMYEMGITQNENEYEAELVGEKEKTNRKVEEIDAQLREIKKVNKRLLNEKDALANREEERKREFSTLEEERNTLKKDCEELRTNLARAMEQMQEREEVIKKKETTIKELRSFNIHLQNFRYVLDEKIKELKEDRGPLGAQLLNLQEQIRNMYAELLDEYEKTEVHSKETKELRSQAKELTKSNMRLKGELFVSKRKLEMLQSDIVQLLRYSNKDNVLLELQRLTDKHLQLDELYSAQEREEEGAEAGLESSDVNKVKSELLYQHDLVREQLAAAQRKSKAHEVKTEQELRLKMKENATLIDECNKLRVQLNEMRRANALLKDENNQLKGQLRETVADGKMQVGAIGRKGSTGELITADIKTQLYRSQKEPRRVKTSSNPNRMGKLVTDLERNQREILTQNLQFQRLQEQVAVFLYNKPSTALGRQESRRVLPSTASNAMSTRLSTMRSNPMLPRLVPGEGVEDKHEAEPSP